MSDVSGISPITPDVEAVRHSDESGYYGDESNGAVPKEASDEDDDEARRVVEGQARVDNP